MQFSLVKHVHLSGESLGFIAMLMAGWVFIKQ